jgi:hypothetical protein
MLVAAVVSFVLVQWVLDPGVSTDGTSGETDVRDTAGFGLEDARQFNDFSIYWVGESFRGLPLNVIQKLHDPGIPGLEAKTADDVVVLGYGDCDIQFGEESCAVPLSITVQPYCQATPEDIDDAVKAGPEFEIRDAKALQTSGSLVIWTNDVHISIAGTSVEIQRDAAENLVALTAMGAKSTSETLGPPSRVECPPHPTGT